LMLFGLSGAVGTMVGGWEADRFGPHRTLLLHVAAMVATMALLPLTQGSYALMLAVLLVWGVAGFGMMAPQQARLAGLSPQQAPMLLSVNSSMLYGGTAIGAAVSGAAAPTVGFAQLSWVGLPFALIGLLLLVLVPSTAAKRRP
jgi:MFS transporter, DHA1 family, inner membrane transport protein